MEIAAEVWFWVGPEATGTARFGRDCGRKCSAIGRLERMRITPISHLAAEREGIRDGVLEALGAAKGGEDVCG